MVVLLRISLGRACAWCYHGRPRIAHLHFFLFASEEEEESNPWDNGIFRALTIFGPDCGLKLQPFFSFHVYLFFSFSFRFLLAQIVVVLLLLDCACLEPSSDYPDGYFPFEESPSRTPPKVRRPPYAQADVDCPGTHRHYVPFMFSSIHGCHCQTKRCWCCSRRRTSPVAGQFMRGFEQGLHPEKPLGSERQRPFLPIVMLITCVKHVDVLYNCFSTYLAAKQWLDSKQNAGLLLVNIAHFKGRPKPTESGQVRGL